MSRKKYICSCPICGEKLGTIHNGAVELECKKCGNAFYVKYSKDVMSVRETCTFEDRYNESAPDINRNTI